jgi:hypothetical protein
LRLFSFGLLLKLYFLINFVAHDSVELAHNLLIYFEVELAIVDLNQQLGVATDLSSLDAGFNLKIEPLDFLADEHKLIELAVELTLALHVVLWTALFDDTLADLQDCFLDCVRVSRRGTYRLILFSPLV